MSLANGLQETTSAMRGSNIMANATAATPFEVPQRRRVPALSHVPGTGARLVVEAALFQSIWIPPIHQVTAPAYATIPLKVVTPRDTTAGLSLSDKIS